MSDASQHPSTFTQRALRWTIGAKRERYEELVHIVERTAVENLEMAECCLSLIEEGVFSICQRSTSASS
jgi:hypothetical protein